MARNEQLIRQHKILQLLEASRFGRRLEELRDELVQDLGLTSLSERTVRRDLDALLAAGMHIEPFETDRGVVWKLGKELASPPVLPASVSELLALSMVRDLAAPLTGTPYGKGLESLWRKMQEAIPEAAWKHFHKRRETLLVRGTPVKSYAEREGIIGNLNRAILQHRAVQIEYQSKDEAQPSVREIEPYSLVFYKSSLYVVARLCQAPEETAVRHFKLDRFHKATVLDRYFPLPPDYDAQEHFAASLGVYKAGEAQEFRIRLHPEVVAWVSESPWHAQQQIQSDEQGRPVLIVPSAYEEEIIPQVLALNVKAEILAPAATRAKVRAYLASMSDLYREPDAR